MSEVDKEYVRPAEEEVGRLQALAAQPPPELPEHCLPTQQYLEKYVLPYIEPAMKATALNRPANPVEFFSYYLLAQRGQSQAQAPAPEAPPSDS